MQKNLKVGIFDTFWDGFMGLPRAQQRKVQKFISTFRREPSSGGINYEHIEAANPAYRSVRIDQAYRCIVMMPSVGDVYLLLWVDHHDDAYDWARRKRIEVHPKTGLLQVYEAHYVSDGEATSSDGSRSPDADGTPPASDATGSQPTRDAAAPPSTDEAHANEPAAVPTDTDIGADADARSDEPLFNLDDTRLLAIGVPESMVEPVAALRTVPELVAMEPRLPIEAYEALYLFAEGCDWHEIQQEYGTPADVAIDTDDVAAALERDGSKRRFHVVESDEELQAILAAPLERWRVYLHPSQRRLIERDWNGPVRVTGGAGTGKTVVAMHRAVWLARRIEGDGKVLFLTYNTNLAADIEANLAKLASVEERERIEVVNIDAWVSRYLKGKRYASRLVFDGELQKHWKTIIDGAVSPPGKTLPASFYTEEWERVVLPNRIESRDAYLRVDRAGRGVALSRRQRAVIWDVFDEMRTTLRNLGVRTYQDATLDARDLIERDGAPLPYRHVVVDETQDMGPEALMLIRALVPEGQNDLFFVGDGHQRIYRRRAVMGRCGIRIIGRARKLKINYRTTEQIRRFASAVLDGQPIDDLDGGEDSSTDYLSLTHGPDATLVGFDDEAAEIRWIVEHVRALADEDGSLAHCCVLLRTLALRDRYARAFTDAELEIVLLDTRADDQAVPGVRVANMHRVKGLEFRHVVIAAMNHDVVPNRLAVGGSDDVTELRDRELAERALLHVCASRAIETLAVTWNGEASKYVVGEEVPALG